MSLLIADSGGTKTDWAFIDDLGVVTEWQGNGLNPNSKDEEFIQKELSGKDFATLTPSEIHFYGAGCSTEANQKRLSQILSSNFPSAIVEVQSDLYAAADSLVGNGSGLVGILGTGANSALFKEGKFVKSRPSYGYLMGDEGSGAYLGKMFLKAWMEEEFGSELLKILSPNRPSEEELVTRLYGGNESVTKVFGSYVPLISKHLNDFPELNDMVLRSFRDYIKYFVNCYTNPPKKCYFVGSIAYYFKPQLHQVLQEQGFSLEKVLQRPMPGLIDRVGGKSEG